MTAPRIEIVPMTLGDVLHVCQNMRQADWSEILNLLPLSVTSADTVAMICMNVSKVGFVAKLDGVPAAVVQMSEILDGTYRVGLFGTDAFRQVALPLTRHLISIIPDMIEDGMTYCEVFADVLHDEALKFLAFLGFRKRAILQGYGSRGRDVVLFTLTKGEANVLWNGRWGRIFNAGGSTDVTGGIRSHPGAAGISKAAGQSAERL